MVAPCGDPMRTTAYLDRYRQGEHIEVWAEMIAFGSAVRQEPLYTEAVAVAREMMTHARHNVALLVERLLALNYRFAEPRDYWRLPDVDLQKTLDAIEQQYGTLPIIVRAWY